MRKVLVLEDEDNIRSFVVLNLNRAGYDTVEATTGEEALELLKRHPETRIALLDVNLPGIDGFEVCRRIRATNAKMGIIMPPSTGRGVRKRSIASQTIKMVITTRAMAFTNAASVVSLSQPKVWRMVGGRRENCTASRAKSRAAVSVNI